MLFDPSQLETFLAVARTGSFTQAARMRGIGQPTVSQHIRKLEQSAAPAVLAGFRTQQSAGDRWLGEHQNA